MRASSLVSRGSIFVASIVMTVGLVGCARDLARSSSSAIGCPPEAIEVSEVSVGWSQMSWTARCRGVTFYCSGESSAQCAPELMEASAPAHEAPATTEAPKAPKSPTAPKPTTPEPARPPAPSPLPPAVEPAEPPPSAPAHEARPTQVAPDDPNEDRDEPTTD